MNTTHLFVTGMQMVNDCFVKLMITGYSSRQRKFLMQNLQGRKKVPYVFNKLKNAQCN